jgi:AraC-like DNA-binding protein
LTQELTKPYTFTILIYMDFLRIKQVAGLTGKSERTIQRLLKQIKQEKPNYYSKHTRKAPGEPKAIEVNEQLLVDYKLIKAKAHSSEQENNRKAPTDSYYLEIFHEQLKAKDKQIEAINDRLREVQLNLNYLMQKIPQLEAPKNNAHNATSDAVSDGIVVDEEQQASDRVEPKQSEKKANIENNKKQSKTSRSTSHKKKNKGLKTNATRAKKGQQGKKKAKKPGFWQKAVKWLNS